MKQYFDMPFTRSLSKENDLNYVPKELYGSISIEEEEQ